MRVCVCARASAAQNGGGCTCVLHDITRRYRRFKFYVQYEIMSTFVCLFVCLCVCLFVCVFEMRPAELDSQLVRYLC